MKSLLFILYVLLLPLSLQAQDMARVKKHIDTLTAPGMHGRGYVQNGDQIAATYIYDRYKEAGLFAFDSSYFQYFSFNINTFPGKVFLKSNTKRLIAGSDFIVHPSSGSGKGCLKVEFIDSLILSDKNCQKKFLQRNFSNKALAMHSRHWKQIQSLPEYSSKIFSAGAFIEIQDNKLTASLAPAQLARPYFQVLAKNFHTPVKKISFWVEAALQTEYETQNVIGYLKGKTYPDSFIVICAHYDHLGRMGQNVYFPGANDNASGVSMMLEFIKHYSRPEYQPEYSIVFMAFGAEEAGLIGSKYYVGAPLFPLTQIKFLINLDLLGTGDNGITVVNATKFPLQFEKLAEINSQKNLLPAVNKRGPAANSDHHYFSEKNVPSFFIYTLGGIAAYHDIYDKAETLPLTKFKEVFQLLTGFIDEL